MKLRSYFSLLAFLILGLNTLQAQDTSGDQDEYQYDMMIVDHATQPSINYEYSIEHNPTKEDELRIKNFRDLIDKAPKKKNAHQYYLLAVALWETNNIQQAEKLFVAITNTGHSFDKNATSQKGFSSNHRNMAYVYLAKICIEKGEYNKALAHIKSAHNMSPDELNGLNDLCARALNKGTDNMK